MPETEVRAAPYELTWSDPARGWHRLRGVLIVAALVLTAIAGVLGERPATLATLEQQVASGDVDVVRVTGDLPDSSSGYTTVTLHWRTSWSRFRAEVIEARPRSAARSVARENGVRIVREDVRTHLSELQPGLRYESSRRPSSESNFLGRHLPGWFGWPILAWALGCLALLVAGPRTWRATRWAWFWLIGAAPPVVLAFLLLGGPTRGLPAPADENRRLTGGWAFLLAILLGGLFRPDR